MRGFVPLAILWNNYSISISYLTDSHLNLGPEISYTKFSQFFISPLDEPEILPYIYIASNQLFTNHSFFRRCRV
jgi:hypothetical protein